MCLRSVGGNAARGGPCMQVQDPRGCACWSAPPMRPSLPRLKPARRKQRSTPHTPATLTGALKRGRLGRHGRRKRLQRPRLKLPCSKFASVTSSPSHSEGPPAREARTNAQDGITLGARGRARGVVGVKVAAEEQRVLQRAAVADVDVVPDHAAPDRGPLRARGPARPVTSLAGRHWRQRLGLHPNPTQTLPKMKP